MLTECQTEEAVTAILLEGSRERLGELNVLVLDGKTTNSNIVSTDHTGRRGAVAVADFPGAATNCLVGAGFGRVIDGVALRSGGLSGLGKISRPDLEIVSFLSRRRAGSSFYLPTSLQIQCRSRD